MRTLVAVTVRTATVVAAGLLTMLLVDRLTGPTVGADIGSGLLAFTVGAALVTVWAFRDGLRAPALARPLVHWLLTAILVALAMGAITRVQAGEPLDLAVLLTELLTVGWFVVALVAVAAAVGAAAGQAARGVRLGRRAAGAPGPSQA